jgi:hypothetical protein
VEARETIHDGNRQIACGEPVYFFRRPVEGDAYSRGLRALRLRKAGRSSA